MAAKITMDMIKPFTGEGDVVSWLKKVTLVAKLQKIADLASFIPLYLEGDALALYLELNEDDQADAKKTEEKLKAAFSDDAFSAFAKLVQMKWTGEPVDVYANEIRRLAGLAKFVGAGLENVVKLTFVNGFPDSINVALQRVPNVLKLEMSDLIGQARILSSKQQGDVVAVATRRNVVKDGRGGRFDNETFQFKGNSPVAGLTPRGPPTSAGASAAAQFKGQCFRCGGPHRIRECKEARVKCFKCHNFGHMANTCPNPDAGNE